MSYIDFNTQRKLRIWEGVSGPVYHSDQSTFGHFTLEASALVPEHAHENEQWTNVLEGEMEFDINGEKTILKAGMTAYIPSNAPHSVNAITQCKVIDCFIPPREDFKELEKEQYPNEE